ncbi:MAG: cytochrome c maturation protein CcmE [Cytophagaceae bacterium]
MKRSHIFAIVLIGLCIAIIISATGDASSYVTFKEAYQMAKNGDTDKVHVVGKLKKDSLGNITGMVYEPTVDPNYFSFILEDSLHEEHQVIYLHPKLPDLDRSEKVVVVGSVRNNVFMADEILLKCPSKYEEPVNQKSFQ